MNHSGSSSTFETAAAGVAQMKHSSSSSSSSSREWLVGCRWSRACGGGGEYIEQLCGPGLLQPFGDGGLRKESIG